MEDWMYASAWDKKGLKRCEGDNAFTSTSENGRSEVFLVETSNSKRPSSELLGNLVNVLNSNFKLPINGHATRNIRLALATIDMVEPYVCIRDVQLDTSEGKGSISWYVGGAYSVTSTFHTVQLAPVTLQQLLDSTDLGYSKSYIHDLVADIDDDVTKSKLAATVSKDTRWSGDGTGMNDIKPSSISTESFQLPRQAGIYWLLVHARVDEKWGESAQGNPSTLSPQSHLANARTNKAWKFEITSSFTINGTSPLDMNTEIDKKQVKGRIYWPSDPIVIEIDATGSAHMISEVYDCKWWSRTGKGGKNSGLTSSSLSSKTSFPMVSKMTNLDMSKSTIFNDQFENIKTPGHIHAITHSIQEGPKRFRLMLISYLMGTVEHLMYYLGLLYIFICFIFIWYCYCRMKQTVKLKSYE